MHNTKITMSQAAVLKGWYVPSRGLWIIPIARGLRAKTANLNTATVVSRVSPIAPLVDTPTLTDRILSVYKLKTRPELVRYYHAAVGFPTQPT